MKVIRVTTDEIAIVNFIVEYLIDHAEEKPGTNHLLKLLNDERTYLFAAITSDQVIGYVLAYTFPSLYTPAYLAYLYNIEVSLIHRRKGAGRLLMETLLAILKSDGVDELWLGTARDNVAAQALFLSTGGIKSGEIFHEFTYELAGVP